MAVFLLVMVARTAAAASFDPRYYLYLIEWAKVYGFVPVTVSLHAQTFGDPLLKTRQANFLRELGDDVLPYGQWLGSISGVVAVYLNENGIRKLIRSPLVRGFIEGYSPLDYPSIAGSQAELEDHLACAGTVDVEVTLKLENLMLALDAEGNTLFPISPALDEELRRELPLFLASLPAAGFTWLNLPQLDSEYMPHFEPKLRLRVNRRGLIALFHHEKTAWIGEVGRGRAPLFLDPALLPAAEQTGSVRVYIELRYPDGYNFALPKPARDRMLADLQRSTEAVVATLGLQEGQAANIYYPGGLSVTLSLLQFQALLTKPDPRIGSIFGPITVTTFSADAHVAGVAVAASYVAPSCPPPVAYPAPGSRFCLKETEREGGLESTSLWHNLPFPVADFQVPALAPAPIPGNLAITPLLSGSIFIGATDKEQPDKLWLMNEFGEWQALAPGAVPVAYASALMGMTTIPLLATPTDLRPLSGRVKLWVGYGKTPVYNDAATAFSEMLGAQRYKTLWTIGGDDDSAAEVCATMP